MVPFGHGQYKGKTYVFLLFLPIGSFRHLGLRQIGNMTLMMVLLAAGVIRALVPQFVRATLLKVRLGIFAQLTITMRESSFLSGRLSLLLPLGLI